MFGRSADKSVAKLEQAFPAADIREAWSHTNYHATTSTSGRVPGVVGVGRLGDTVGLFFYSNVLGKKSSVFLPLVSTTVTGNKSMSGNYTIVQAPGGVSHTFLTGSHDLLRAAQLGSVGQLV